MILERTSTLQEHSTLVGGGLEIVRFLYATEGCEYELYPQNPLERAKLDQFLSWYQHNKTAVGLIRHSDLAILEEYFIGETQHFLCGMHDMTIVDMLCYLALVPVSKAYLESKEGRQKFMKIARWVERMDDQDEVAESAEMLRVDDKDLQEARKETNVTEPKL